MNRILVDTSAYSVSLKGHVEATRVMQEADALMVNPVVLGELRFGFRRGKRREENERELGIFLSSPRVCVIAIDEETSETYAVILETLWRAGRPIPSNDVWIAASAMQHGLTILTADRHFLHVPHVMVDYFVAG